MIGLYIFLAVFGLLIILLFAFSFYMHNKMYGKRWEPDGITKYYTVEDFPELVTEEISFEMKNKSLIKGYIHSYNYDTYKGIIVFSHGMWGSFEAYLQEINELAKAGYKVIAYDNEGTDISGGKNIVGVANSVNCLATAIDFAKKRFPDMKIMTMGHSWGGFATSAIAKYHPDLAKVVTMSPFVSIKRILMDLLPKPLYILIPFIIFVDFIKCGSSSFANNKKILKNSRIPTLIVHSKDDKMVSLKHNTEYLMRKIKNKNIEYLIVDGRNHNPDYTIEAVNYMKECFKKMKALPKEKVIEYRKNIDYHKMGELDHDIFSLILDFLNK